LKRKIQPEVEATSPKPQAARSKKIQPVVELQAASNA